ncbi:twin-arginine translocation signal domain-containing protein [Candidatus Microgenomates bacterium]|nr:twin-arginine translocation signal domain-containing protein [Candidatus Microgenomates bacterium]
MTEDSNSNGPRISRRNFLKATGLAIGMAAVSPKDSAQFLRGLIPEKVKEDLLSPEELKKNRIKIYQTPKTELYLRRGVLEFPLFKAAAEGKFDEVAIVLVERHSLNYSGYKTFPEEPRLMWKAAHETKKSEDYEISKVSSHYEDEIKKRDEWVETLQKLINQDPPLPENIEAEYKEWMNDYRSRQELYRKILQMLAENPQKTLDFVYDEVDVRYGGMINGSAGGPEFFKKHPELAKKVFIYLAVGGPRAPRPEDSYLDPRFPMPRIPGFTLRHEISHYNWDTGVVHSENESDSMAFDSIINAFNKFRQNEDTSGYPFVFVNKHGVTVTKQLEDKQKRNQV